MEESRLLESEGFQVFRTIGHGQFGQVFLVHRPEVGFVVAKVMDTSNFDQNEWDVAGILKDVPPEICPFFVRSILAKQCDQMTIILMEFANLGNLQRIIDANIDIPIPIIRVIMQQLLYGLFYIHSKGIIHRDIKPANIMLHSPPGSGRVITKIGDFGEVKIKKRIDYLTLMTQRGTLPYMPPEMFLALDAGKVQADSNVDIWSLGITFYQIVTHTFPFQTQSTFMEQYKKTGILNRPPSIKDKNLWDLITQMLKFDPKERISASDALKHPFFTSYQAKKEVTEEQFKLVQLALEAQRNGNKEITQFDTNDQFVFPLTEVQKIIGNVDPNSEMEQLTPFEQITQMLVDLIKKISKKGSTEQTHQLFEMGIIQTLTQALKNKDKYLQSSIQETFTNIIQKGWKQIKPSSSSSSNLQQLLSLPHPYLQILERDGIIKQIIEIILINKEIDIKNKNEAIKLLNVIYIEGFKIPSDLQKQLIEQLTFASKSDDEDQQKYALEALSYLSFNKENHDIIIENDGIEIASGFIKEEIDGKDIDSVIVKYSLLLLLNLVTFGNPQTIQLIHSE
ncbi:MAG: putative AUR protein kinase, partial [Streblomastix strix]